MEDIFDSTTIEVIRDFLVKHDETIAVAESVTSGFIQLAFSTAKEASKFYQGGITTYNIGQKYRHLHIEPIHALSCNCVSEKVAREMALNVCDLFQSDWGIGITGYAAPVPESNGKLFAYYTVVFRKNVIINKRVEANEEDSIKVQLNYVNHLLDDIMKYFL